LTELYCRIEVIAGIGLPGGDSLSVLTVLHCQRRLMCLVRLWSEYAAHSKAARTWNASRGHCAGLAKAVTCVKGAAHYIAAVEVLSREEANMKSLLAGCQHVGP
jgi:hypothetical protein